MATASTFPLFSLSADVKVDFESKKEKTKGAIRSMNKLPTKIACYHITNQLTTDKRNRFRELVPM